MYSGGLTKLRGSEHLIEDHLPGHQLAIVHPRPRPTPTELGPPLRSRRSLAAGLSIPLPEGRARLKSLQQAVHHALLRLWPVHVHQSGLVFLALLLLPNGLFSGLLQPALPLQLLALPHIFVVRRLEGILERLYVRKELFHGVLVVIEGIVLAEVLEQFLHL